MYFISLLPSSGHERPTTRAVHLPNNGDLKLERLILQLAFFNIFGNAEAGGRITCAFDGVYNNDPMRSKNFISPTRIVKHLKFHRKDHLPDIFMTHILHYILLCSTLPLPPLKMQVEKP